MLQVQVHITMPKPALGIVYSKGLLDELAGRWMRGKRLPNGVKVSAIEWRNGAKPWVKEVRPAQMKSARINFWAVPFRFSSVQTVGRT